MEEKSSVHDNKKESRDVVLELNFVPQWARKPPGESHYTQKEYSGGDRPMRHGGRPSSRRDAQTGDQSRRPRRETFERREVRRPVREPVKELPVSVSFLPEQKRLASLVRQIHHSRRAYPLMDLANLMIRDAEGYLVKLEVEKGAEKLELFQCKQCRAVASSEEMIRQHIMSCHLTDFYEEEEVEADPPSGNFPGVARCTKTGVLLGPPNHHSYTERLNELHQSRFSHLLLEEYKQYVEVVKGDELVEQWREQNRKQTLYRRKGDAEAAQIDLRKAELAFSKMVPELYESVHRAVLPSGVAQKLDDRDLMHTIHRMWSKENRFPLTMSFAMRAAFRHMHLYAFKAGKVNFVTHIKPNPVNPADTVANIAEVLMFLKENPGSTRMDLLAVLHPSLDPQSQEAKEALQPLSWLIERGHIIEFFNGTLAIPLGRRHR
jgi:hypothetical protein